VLKFFEEALSMLDLAYTALLDFLARLQARVIRSQTFPKRFVAYRSDRAENSGKHCADGRAATPKEPKEMSARPTKSP
jgi:hypothetical protein